MPASRAELGGYLQGIGQSLVQFQFLKQKQQEKIEQRKQQLELFKLQKEQAQLQLDREKRLLDKQNETIRDRQNFIKQFQKEFGSDAAQGTQDAQRQAAQAAPSLTPPAPTIATPTPVRYQGGLDQNTVVPAQVQAELSQPQKPLSEQRAPDFARNDQYIKIGIAAANAGHDAIGLEFIKRGLGPAALDVAKYYQDQTQTKVQVATELRQNVHEQFQQQLDLRKQAVSERQQALSEKEFGVTSRDKALAYAKSRQEFTDYKKRQSDIESYAQSLAHRSVNESDPAKAQRYQDAARLVLVGKIEDANKLVNANGPTPTKASLAELATSPYTPENLRKGYQDALKLLESNQLRYNPDGSIQGSAKAKLEDAYVKKYVLPRIDELTANKIVYDQIQQARKVLNAAPAAAGVPGSLALFARGFKENFQTLFDPEKGKSLINAYKDLGENSLATHTQQLDFFKKSLATILAIRFNGGSGRLTDEDFKRGQDEVDSRFSSVSSYSSYLTALNTIQDDIYSYQQSLVPFIQPYFDISDKLLPPRQEQAAPVSAAPPASGFTITGIREKK